MRLELALGALPLPDGVGDRELAATGGEDYELCVCVGVEDAARAAGVTWVGEVVSGRVVDVSANRIKVELGEGVMANAKAPEQKTRPEPPPRAAARPA